MSSSPEQPLASGAEALFLEHLQRHDDGAEESFEDLCVAHPQHAGELGDLRRRWDLVQRLAAEAAGSLAPPDAPGATGLDPETLARLDVPRRVIERYVAEEPLARGAQGTVSRALDLDLRRHVAMKVLHGEDAGRHAARRAGRFLDEAQVTAQLDHPGIVPIHDLGLDREGRLFFTMKLVQGRSLHEVLLAAARGDPASWSRPRIVGALLRVAEAMAFAHDRGVIHRDLKPANVMLGDYGEVYVMDWGLARLQPAPEAMPAPSARAAPDEPHAVPGGAEPGDAPRTLDGDVVGTPQYMSPEQAAGRAGDVDLRTDVYALGAMLYHALAGRAPYEQPAGRGGETRLALTLLALVRAGPPAPLRTLAADAPPELQAVCDKAMAREPSERYASMAELASDLRAWLEGRVVRAYETGPWAELKKWIRRNRALTAVSIAALVATIGGLAWSSHVEAAGRRVAEDARAQADANLSDLRRLAEIKRLSELEARAAALWPADPARVDGLRAWLDDARELVGHLDAHRAALERVRQGTGTTGLERSWWEETLAELITRTEAFAATLVPDVEKRLAFAQSIEERSIGAHRREWEQAIASIGDKTLCPEYGGLVIAPQLGLVPLGRDPRSHLWEFWHLPTGDQPGREPDGAVAPTEAMGVVFVLLPGGTFLMGAQHDDPAAPHYDEQARSDEGPVASVSLDPFFMSKYEMTQGQWVAVTGANPSSVKPGAIYGEVVISLRNPVENVTRNECERVLRRVGLELPTEAQWEYAARAGTDTCWWTGAERESLRGAENLADASAARAGAPWPALADWPDLEDGFILHAPVGSMRANPFGLLDVSGNVTEFCREPYELYPARRRSGDGASEVPGDGSLYRGGVFGSSARDARVSHREGNVPDAHANSMGVRPMRVFDAAGSR